MHPVITSAQNPRIKNLLSLAKPRERRSQGVFLIEGVRELGLAVGSGYEVEQVFYCRDIISERELTAIVHDERLLMPVDRSVFEKIAYRESTGGIMAVTRQKQHPLSAIALREAPFILVVESVEKPGNLGALLRTADAANLDAVISCDPQTDFYNPNVIRSSVGCVFTTQVASASSTETIAWLRSKGISIYCTYLTASKPYYLADFTKPCAVVMGTEATGLTPQWAAQSDQNIIIPMEGKIDSMNVSTAAAAIIFEGKRQRRMANS